MVEHVRLVPQLCVLAKVLPYHLHPLHLQPLQLLPRRKPTETSGGVSLQPGDLPPTRVLDHPRGKTQMLPDSLGSGEAPTPYLGVKV